MRTHKNLHSSCEYEAHAFCISRVLETRCKSPLGCRSLNPTFALAKESGTHLSLGSPTLSDFKAQDPCPSLDFMLDHLQITFARNFRQMMLVRPLSFLIGIGSSDLE